MMKRCLSLGLVLLAIGAVVAPGTARAEPPPGSGPIGGLPAGLYSSLGTSSSWYDTLLGAPTVTDGSGSWTLAVTGAGGSQTLWGVINVTSVAPEVTIHGDLWRIGTAGGALNGVTATLWADRNGDGRFGPTSLDGSALAQDVTHCVAAPNWCGDYVLSGSDGSYPRGITLELGTPPSGTYAYHGFVWTE